MIRDALPADAAALSELLTQLGYPASANEVAARLARVQRRSRVVVAVAAQGIPAGLIVLATIDALEHDLPLCMVVALVVRDRDRRRGVGAELLAEAERWAVDQGCGRIVLGTAHHRTEAIRFYRSHGYQETGLRLVKPLSDRTFR
jgi:GNAT superfamily N-acetyltransferase